MKQVSRLENLFFDRKLGLSETLLIGFDKLVFFYLKKQTNKTKTKRKTKQNKQTKQVLISIRKANLVALCPHIAHIGRVSTKKAV